MSELDEVTEQRSRNVALPLSVEPQRCIFSPTAATEQRWQRACAVHPGARRCSVLKWGGWQKNSGDGHYTAGLACTMSLIKHRHITSSYLST
ncbi:uncharacterized protein V6R79_014893 [Siganus canaliculatus]